MPLILNSMTESDIVNNFTTKKTTIKNSLM